MAFSRATRGATRVPGGFAAAAGVVPASARSYTGASAEAGSLALLPPLNRLRDQLACFSSVAPAEHLHPLAALEIFVVLEEMPDLLQRDLRHVGVIHHMLIALG